MTIQDKTTFIQLLVQKFPSNSCNTITDRKVSAKLLFLIQKKDEDLYIYYCWIEGLLKRIYKQDQITNNGRDIMTFSLFKQQLLKNIIMRFILGIKNFDFQFCIVEY